MYCGHVIYKVKHLQTAVQKWREKGFVVEYGTLNNPKNALIYFSEGAYIELLEHTGIPKIVKLFSKIFGKSKRLERFFDWDACEEGWCGLCFEKSGTNLDEEIAFLKENGIDGTLFKSLKRIDIHQRELKYQCYFPLDKYFPFLMLAFSIDPKPKQFVHPNHISKLKKIIFYTNEAYANVLQQLVKDDCLEIRLGDQMKIDVEYESAIV